MPVSKAQIIATVDQAFAALGATSSVLPANVTAGKMYEAWVLAHLLERLSSIEGFTFSFHGGSNLVLKSSPGPINRRYAHFYGVRGSDEIEVWTDVEFRTFSHARLAVLNSPFGGFKHELDIIVVPVGTRNYPAHDEILLGVECKATTFRKDMERAILGVRRELSVMRNSQRTAFRMWPTARVNAWPASVVAVCSTDPAVAKYAPIGDLYGIEFMHLPLP